MKFWSSKLLRVKVAGAIVGAISLGGFAVAAAAVVKEPTPHVVSASDVTTSPPTDPTTTDPTTTPTDPPVTVPATDPPVTDPTTAPTTTACVEHGDDVSQVAHETEPGPDHGATVSHAAHDHDADCDDDATEVRPPKPPEPADNNADGSQGDGEHHQSPHPLTNAPQQTDGHGHGDHHGGGGGD